MSHTLGVTKSNCYAKSNKILFDFWYLLSIMFGLCILKCKKEMFKSINSHDYLFDIALN